MERKEYIGGEIPEVAEGKLPESIDYGGKKYTLKAHECSDENFGGWWFFGYMDETDRPANVHDKEYWYYLCAMGKNREEAYNDILEKYTNMVKE